MQVQEDKRKGAFYGCLVGDALGAPVEFKWRDTFPEVREMIPCRHFGLEAGSFTDDGSLMLCLAAALIHTQGQHDPHIVLSHYVEWYRNGYMSVIDECFDIGRTTEKALSDFERFGITEANTKGVHEAGNGSLMRIVPIPLLFGDDLAQTWDMAIQESCTTHACEVATWCCGVWSCLIAMALQGKSKADFIQYFQNLTYIPDSCVHIQSLDFLKKSRDEIKSGGYVLESLECALWALFSTETFEDGLVAVVNLGGDADTNGAVFGSLAGALYGYESIPSRWLCLQKKEMVENIWLEFESLCKKKEM
jgi:ADP-ribosyl-[dinitrogen reductase] hydrolase